MVDVAESAGPVDRLLHLLLAMTGRVDDDAINAAREMLGVGRPDAAAELLAGCLVAGRIPVSSTEQYQLRRVLDEVRSHHSLADRLHVVDAVPEEAHRFGEKDESDTDLINALTPIVGRLSGVRALWCAWRVTPAGVSYGAVPRRVLLAEVGSDGSVTAVGYQLLEALRRAGIGCSVDVYSSGMQLPEYHRDALATAHRVHVNLPSPVTSQNGAPRARAARSPAMAGEAAAPSGGHDLPSEPPIPDRRAEPEPAVDTHQETPLVGVPSVAPRTELAPVASPDGKAEGANNMRVPAAVDAKLTDRERNLLRKLHEELAQREQDRDVAGRNVPSRRPVQDARTTTLPGTGGFPPISAAASANYHGHGGQSHG